MMTLRILGPVWVSVMRCMLFKPDVKVDNNGLVVFLNEGGIEMKELAMNDNLEKELRALIAEILEIDEIKITSDARFVEELGMDSMMALEILAAAEKKYKIKIAEEHLIKITTLKNITEIVKTLIENK